MKTSILSVFVGVGFILSATTCLPAQTITNKQVTRAAKASRVRVSVQSVKAPKRRAGNQSTDSQGLNSADTHFTDSGMSSVTRAGSIGNQTGAAGSDVNGQIGTTNQGNMVHGPMGGLYTSHFGSGGKKTKTAKPGGNPPAKNLKSSRQPTG